MRKQITTIPQIKFLSLPGYNKFVFNRSISVILPAVIWLRSVRLFRMSTHFGPMCCARVWQDCLNVLSLPRRTSWSGVGKTVEMYCHFPGGRHEQVLARLLKCTVTSQADVMIRCWQDCWNLLSLLRRTSWAGVGKTVEMYCHFPGGLHEQVLARLLKCTVTSQAEFMSRCWRDCWNVLPLPRRTSWAGVGKTVEMYCHFPGGRHEQVFVLLLFWFHT